MTTPVIFIPGLWLHAESWQPWVELYGAAGYDPAAPGWPGSAATVDEARANPEGSAGYGINEITDHYARIIKSLDAKPVVIGHSFGGLIAQKLLGQGLAAAAVAVDPAQMKGVLALPLSTLRVGFPVLSNPANRRHSVMLTEAQFRYGFGNAVSAAESADLYQRWAVPSPGKPLFEAAFANFSPDSPAKVNTANANRGPLLITAGQDDHTVPPVLSRAASKRYRGSTAVTDFAQFPGRGHTLTIDHGWPEIAQASLSWLNKHDL
jgi:pimeloyl-ACP methyl ester carboxylesterase